MYYDSDIFAAQNIQQLRRIILIWVAIQVSLIAAVSGQDDSSAVQPPAAYAPDSLAPKPVREKTIPVKQVKPEPVYTDTVPQPAKNVPASLGPYGNALLPYIAGHPYYSVSSDVIFMPSKWHTPERKDELFYIFCGVIFFLGILRVGFPKYFQDIFNVFWRSAFRQKQIRDQLQQAGMTTLLFNIFFVFSASLFSYLVIVYTTSYKMQPWLLFTICFFSIAVIYIGKYFILKLTGWMFGQQAVADSYIFIVFLVNKIVSIVLIPLMLILAFGDPVFQQVAFTVSIVLLCTLLIYRFILSFTGLHSNELRISPLHLVLYVCGFEIIPVLVIYKLLLHLFARSS
ncbi:DUF4271 domain-containing protein [Agriterribacter sp.]|uniref:DUF4271 domain-containing protein n=1 Tax=Agriterribacter sp. TaxID=2821509 RepID=UPI002BF2A217|nr:DUF4271 domain-containing protein [Agriterribacter sp.]HTN05314.1 DUF4271 domain-containing protein [Agriterribacter sp.]